MIYKGHDINKLMIMLIIIVVISTIFIAWSALTLEKIDVDLEHWDTILEEAEE